MTSLIDVIFLLLLFFMLTSTFSRFAEVELAAAGGSAGAPSDTRPFFLRLEPEALSLNGKPETIETLPAALTREDEAPTPVLISLRDGVNSQRLTDLLVVLRGLPNLQVTVLGAS